MKDVDTCFWCLKPLDENEKYEKGVDRMVFHGYTPCKRCKQMFDRGIHVIGTTKEPTSPGMLAIGKGYNDESLYPTGAMFIGSEDWVKSFLSDEKDQEILKNVLESRVMLMPDEVVNEIVKELQKHNPDLPDLVNDDGLMDEQNGGEVIVEKTDNKLKGE